MRRAAQAGEFGGERGVDRSGPVGAQEAQAWQRFGERIVYARLYVPRIFGQLVGHGVDAGHLLVELMLGARERGYSATHLD